MKKPIPYNQSLVWQCQGCQNARKEKNICDGYLDPGDQWSNDQYCCFAAQYPGVYLAGSIVGHSSMAAANLWRERVTPKLAAAGFRVFNPLAGRKQGAAYDAEEIVDTDLAKIDLCDYLLVEVDDQEKCHIGTAMEIRYSYERLKTIILFGQAFHGHPWLAYHASEWYETEDEAVAALIAKRPPAKETPEEEAKKGWTQIRTGTR